MSNTSPKISPSTSLGSLSLFVYPKMLRRWRPRALTLAFILGIVNAGMATAGLADAMLLGDVDKGEAYSQQKCTSCHVARFGNEGNEIYTREDRRVKTVEGLMQQVQFCNANTGAGFSEEQLDDITAYLNERFYQFGDE